jgi:hypothetical protein
MESPPILNSDDEDEQQQEQIIEINISEIGIESRVLLPLLHYAALPQDLSDLDQQVSVSQLKRHIVQMRLTLARFAEEVMNQKIEPQQGHSGDQVLFPTYHQLQQVAIKARKEIQEEETNLGRVEKVKNLDPSKIGRVCPVCSKIFCAAQTGVLTHQLSTSKCFRKGLLSTIAYYPLSEGRELPHINFGFPVYNSSGTVVRCTTALKRAYDSLKIMDMKKLLLDGACPLIEYCEYIESLKRVAEPTNLLNEVTSLRKTLTEAINKLHAERNIISRKMFDNRLQMIEVILRWLHHLDAAHALLGVAADYWKNCSGNHSHVIAKEDASRDVGAHPNSHQCPDLDGLRAEISKFSPFPLDDKRIVQDARDLSRRVAANHTEFAYSPFFEELEKLLSSKGKMYVSENFGQYNQR